MGRGIPVYSGLSRISGHGYGNFFSNVWRFLSPIVAPSMQIVRREALDSGIKILSDLAQKKPLKPTLKKHLNTAGKNIITTSLKRLQGGKKVNIRPKTKNKKQSCSKPRKDIFS